MKATAADVAASGWVSRKAPGRAAAEGSPNSAGILRVMHQSASSGPVAAQASAAMRDSARIFSISVEADKEIISGFCDIVTQRSYNFAASYCKKYMSSLYQARSNALSCHRRY